MSIKTISPRVVSGELAERPARLHGEAGAARYEMFRCTNQVLWRE